MGELPRLGGYSGNALVGGIEFRLEDLDETRMLHGMIQGATWLYGGVATSSGARYIYERKFARQMTGGLWLMTDQDGDLGLVPKAVHTARGELRREFTPGRRVYRDHLMAKLGDLTPADEQSLHVELSDDAVTWREGELLDVQGPGVGPGLQFMHANRESSVAYVTRMCPVKGTVLGEEAEGVVGIDTWYGPGGGEWKEHPFYTEDQVSFIAFFNQYDDGSCDFGHVVRGIGGFGVCNIASADGVVLTTNRYDDSFALDDDGYIVSASIRAGDQDWEYTADPVSRMVHFTKARWSGYRAQHGTFRRVGDSRTATFSFGWLEAFSDRIRAEGLATSGQEHLARA